MGIRSSTSAERVDRVTRADIKTLTVHDGTFEIETHDARWFSRKGRFQFEYGSMGNARLFLHALEHLAGYVFN